MKLKSKLISLAAALITAASVSAVAAGAEWERIGFLGDLNRDQTVTVADLLLLSKHLLGHEPLTRDNNYKTSRSYVSIDGGDYFLSDEYIDTADINQDGTVDVFDLVFLRRNVINAAGPIVWQWFAEDTATTTTTAATTAVNTTTTSVTTTAELPVTTTTGKVQNDTPIKAPVADLYGSLPSQGDAKAVVFYVDFPDCSFTYEPSMDEIREITFGESDANDKNYPYDSIAGFYDRSSKGIMSLDGDAFRYTTKQNKSAYETVTQNGSTQSDPWHVLLINEIIEEYKDKIDFTQFDGNSDGTIDAILICVPTAAGDTYWWPAAGQFGGESSNRADGMNIGHVIVGNAQIESASDYKNYCSTYLHEMGHCMGLPDYYLYSNYSDDGRGLHGAAGFEMMDDANGDFGAASKLMLGWYTESQVNVYDASKGEQTFTLNNAQGSDSNCLIIPYGTLKDNYYSEFFILEYTSLDGANSSLASDFWWMATGSGVRAFHIEATNNGNRYYNYWKYASGEDANTNYNAGRRFIRLVNEGTDSSNNLFTAGSVINSSVTGFQWYDSNGGQTVDPGIEIKIDELSGDAYTVTVSSK